MVKIKGLAPPPRLVGRLWVVVSRPCWLLPSGKLTEFDKWGSYLSVPSSPFRSSGSRWRFACINASPSNRPGSSCARPRSQRVADRAALAALAGAYLARMDTALPPEAIAPGSSRRDCAAERRRIGAGRPGSIPFPHAQEIGGLRRRFQVSGSPASRRARVGRRPLPACRR